jgi:hypothetical protein
MKGRRGERGEKTVKREEGEGLEEKREEYFNSLVCVQ